MLIRGLKSALNGQVVVGPLCDKQYGIDFGAGVTPYMCNYLREAFRSLHLSGDVGDAFSYYSFNIWGIRISDSGATASSGLPQALGIGGVYISPQALYDLRRLYYRQMITDLLKEQRAYKRLKRFVTLYEEALASDEYNQAVEDGNAYLCLAVPIEKGQQWFEKHMARLLEAEGFGASWLGLVHRMARLRGWGEDVNFEALEAGVNFSYNARLRHQDRLAELKEVLNGSHV